jgi:predicted AlkP superfamily pyrophosphatase or phosphodiesterase
MRCVLDSRIMNRNRCTFTARRLLSAAIFIAAGLLGARLPAGAKPGLAGRPKLVVLIVVDQMRADYLERYAANFHDGFRRLMKDGAWFTNAAYPYAKTVTCAGHSTVATGDFPSTHGMINNTWWDRTTGKLVTCTGDPKSSLIVYGAAAAGAAGAKVGESDWQMKAPSFAEQLRAQSRGSRIVAISLKARAAISMAGHGADSVTWLNGENWATSTAYAHSPRPEIEAYVKSHPIKADFGKELSVRPDGHGTTTELPAAIGADLTPDGLRSTIKYWKDYTYDEWEASPLSDAYLEKLAEAEIEGLKLGHGKGTDFLAISFSALDIVGHAKGPDSFDVEDVLFYLDATLGELFDELDRNVGKGNYVVALTGDHGVARVPEVAAKDGVDAGRADVGELTLRVTKALAAFGGGEKPVAAFADGDLYFAAGIWDKISAEPKALEAVIAAIRGVVGVADVFRVDQLGGLADKNPLARAALLSEYPGRGGDLFVISKPNWFFDRRNKLGGWGEGTTHGAPYDYDQRVPIILMGAGIAAGKNADAVTPADIAPTFAELTGIAIAHTDGRPLPVGTAAEKSR